MIERNKEQKERKDQLRAGAKLQPTAARSILREIQGGVIVVRAQR
jgi:hypothetical protein